MVLPTPKRVKGLLELMDEALDMDAAKEAVARLGLKEGNTAADRAKAMGFSDDTYYHGTNKNFNKFDYDFASKDGTDQWGSGFYTTDSPSLASGYASGDGAVVMPLKIKKNKSLNYNFENDFLSSSANQNPITKKQLQNILESSPDFENVLWNFGDIGHEGKEAITKKAVNAYMNNEISPTVDLDLNKINTIGNDFFRNNAKDLNKAVEKTSGVDSINIVGKLSEERNPTRTITNVLNPANIRSQFAKFNPKYAGIGAGSIMSSNLLAAPSGQPEFREAPMSLLDKAKKYAADSYEYAANEGGPIGKFLYSGGAEALKDIEQGTTPMVKTGRLPAMPTGAALANLLELLQL